jgi:hypothetical protein
MRINKNTSLEALEDGLSLAAGKLNKLLFLVRVYQLYLHVPGPLRGGMLRAKNRQTV